MDETTYGVNLKPVPLSARAARRFARSCLEAHNGDVDHGLSEDVLLLVSELVSNSVRHAGPHNEGDTIELRLQLAADRIRIEVTDHSSALPIMGDGAVDKLSGRGMLLVDRIAGRWGVAPTASGKTVWLEIGQ